MMIDYINHTTYIITKLGKKCKRLLGYSLETACKIRLIRISGHVMVLYLLKERLNL